jgi:hypothetical protein
MMKGLEKFILRVNSTWHTPASDYPLKRIGTAEIIRIKKNRDYYRMEGVGGYVFYRATQPFKLTVLTINGHDVMTDGPINWIGMQKLAESSRGRVLCGGLGLGLIVHALVSNEKVRNITVSEINPDVIKLIKPLLPTDKKPVDIKLCDIYKFPKAEAFDTIILDMWVGKGSPVVAEQMLSALAHFKVLNPKNQVFIWGHGMHAVNPAVDDKVRARIPKEYWIT